MFFGGIICYFVHGVVREFQIFSTLVYFLFLSEYHVIMSTSIYAGINEQLLIKIYGDGGVTQPMNLYNPDLDYFDPGKYVKKKLVSRM